MSGLHPQAAALLEPPGLSVREVPVADQRAEHESGTPAKAGTPRAVASVSEGEAGGVPVRIYEPFGAPVGTVVVVHGGGWVLGSLDSYDHVARALCVEAGATVVSVGYRLAPEHPFPAPLDDAWAVLRWAAERLGPLAICGDSAGGNLAAACARRARDEGIELALQVLVYPCCDAAMDAESWTTYARGYMLGDDEMAWFWEQYLGDGVDPADPDVSPLRCEDLSGLAPAVVISASHDVLRDECEAYALALRAAGVPTRLERYEGQMHGFWRTPGLIDDAHRAHREAGLALWAAMLGS